VADRGPRGSGADAARAEGGPADDAALSQLRPLERAVLHRLAEGMAYDDLARRLHRDPGFVEFVESMARYKLARH